MIGIISIDITVRCQDIDWACTSQFLGTSTDMVNHHQDIMEMLNTTKIHLEIGTSLQDQMETIQDLVQILDLIQALDQIQTLEDLIQVQDQAEVLAEEEAYQDLQHLAHQAEVEEHQAVEDSEVEDKTNKCSQKWLHFLFIMIFIFK